MPKKPTATRGFEHPKIRAKRITISLSGKALHALPKIAQANEGWIADTDTLEIELETLEGQRVIVPLSGYAVENLVEILDQVMKLKNTAQE
jgi:cell division septal protein FtsQ